MSSRSIRHTLFEFLLNNMILFRWIRRVLFEWRNLGIGIHRWDGGTF